MVCNLQGRESFYCGSILNFQVTQRGAKEGETGFCPQYHSREIMNPDEVAWPNATEVLFNYIVKTQFFENAGMGFLPQVMQTLVRKEIDI